MKNIKKVGLSALAGSLVAFSANAVDMSVTGTAEVTYTTNGGTNSVTGNHLDLIHLLNSLVLVT